MTLKKQTPTLREVIEEALIYSQISLNTCMPGTIKSYNPTKNLATITPAFKREYTDGTIVPIPDLSDVPIIFPRANAAAITFPLKKGDGVILIFAQRSLEQWKSFGGQVDPLVSRMHDLSDAVAIPGGYSLLDQVPVEPNKLAVRYRNSKILLSENGDIEINGLLGKIKVGKTGKITIGNGTIDLLDLVDQMIDAIMALTVGTALGPSSVPINIASFLKIKTFLALIKE